MTNSTLRLGFAGTPALAAAVLEALLENDFAVEVVYTRPDKPAGRGRQVQSSPVKNIATQHNLPVFQPDSPHTIDPDDQLAKLDLLIVVAYGMLLPATVLKRPRLGCVNIHTSLLPRWRGAAPVQRAIEAGDKETGVSIMQMDEGLDTGPVLAQKSCPITVNETSGSLYEKLAVIGAECLIETLGKIEKGDISAVPQDPALVTYAKKITKAEARLDWSRPATILERRIRAFNPAPVAYTEFNGVQFRIWEAQIINSTANAVPGVVLACEKSGLDIATGDGVLRLIKIQPAGKRIMTVQEFLNGRPDFFNY